MRWVRRELVADRYGTRARVHRRRRRAPDVADRRLRHEHRHPGRGRSRLEARGRHARLGRQRAAALLRDRAPAGRRAQRHGGEPNLGRMLSTRQRLPPPEIFQPGAAGDAARTDYGALVHRDDAARVVHHRLPPRLPLRQFADRLADGTPAPPLETASYTQTARPGARAPHAWLPDGRSTLDLFGRGFALLRLGADAPDAREHAAPRRPQAGVPLDVVDARRAGGERAL